MRSGLPQSINRRCGKNGSPHRSGPRSCSELAPAERAPVGISGYLAESGAPSGTKFRPSTFRVDQIWYIVNPDDEQDRRIEVFVEHENDSRRLAETVRKLLELGPGLKVVVTYPPLASKSDLLSQMSRLIQQRYGTPADSRVTVVFGFLYEHDATVLWEAHELDGMGRISGITLPMVAAQSGIALDGTPP